MIAFWLKARQSWSSRIVTEDILSGTLKKIKERVFGLCFQFNEIQYCVGKVSSTAAKQDRLLALARNEFICDANNQNYYSLTGFCLLSVDSSGCSLSFVLNQ